MREAGSYVAPTEGIPMSSVQPPARRLTAHDLHPELKRFRFLPNTPVRSRLGRTVARTVARLVRPPSLEPGVCYDKLDLGQGAVLHVFSPSTGGSDAGLLWIHGGGMVVGAASQDSSLCVDLVRELRLSVASMDYRLAPEHPFPTPMDDCHAGWKRLVERSEQYGLNPARIAVGGQSAGGGIAAGLVQRLHDEGGVQPAAQWLFCPMLDDRTAADRQQDRVSHFLWNNRANRYGWRAYLQTEPGAPTVPPYASPSRRTGLAGLPPAWIGTGDIDLFYAENRAYADALTAAGVDCTLEVVHGAAHAFETVAANTRVARDYTAHARAWLRDRMRL